MDVLDLLTKLWPVLFAGLTLVVVLAKMDQRVAILEEKMKTAFDLINKISQEHHHSHHDHH